MRSLATWIACAATLLAPLSVSAEAFLDLYAGMTFTTDDNTKIETGPPVIDTGNLRDDTSFDPAVTGGARLGWWTEKPGWLGLALDVSHLRPEEDGGVGKDLEMRLTPVSVLLMARYPLLANDDAPGGVIQPYMGLGPTFVFSKARFHIGAARYEDGQFDLGLDARAGLAGMLGKHLGLFAEYRLIYFTADYGDSFGTSQAKISVDHLSNGVVGGVTLRFGGP